MINGIVDAADEEDEDEEANKTHNTDMRVRSHLLNEGGGLTHQQLNGNGKDE